MRPRTDNDNEPANGRAAAASSADRPGADHQAPHAADVPLLLRARDAAAACGVSSATWWRWAAAGRCPAPLRIGSTVRWRRDELLAWTGAGCPDRAKWQAMNAQPSGRR